MRNIVCVRNVLEENDTLYQRHKISSFGDSSPSNVSHNLTWLFLPNNAYASTVNKLKKSFIEFPEA